MSEVQEETPVVMVGPGKLLKSARQQAQLSVQDIAQKLHLKSSVITDIEDDIYDSNISLTFIRGYLKLYAKQVMVTEAEIIGAFDSINTQKKEPAKLHSFSQRVANQANDDKLMMVSYLILAVVLALVVIWWFQQSDNDTAMIAPQVGATDYQSTEILGEQASGVLESLTQPIDESQTDIPNVAPQSGDDNMASQEPAQSQEQGESIPIFVDTQGQVIPAPEQITAELNSLTAQTQSLVTEQNVALAAPVQLVFEFSGDCWMNLSAASGEDIAYGVKAKGRVMSVSGIPPFTVTLGAPQVVQISYGGKAVDMSNFKAGNTAKFTLPIS
jgi:cytoskeleton protein RodZ